MERASGLGRGAAAAGSPARERGLQPWRHSGLHAACYIGPPAEDPHRRSLSACNRGCFWCTAEGRLCTPWGSPPWLLQEVRGMDTKGLRRNDKNLVRAAPTGPGSRRLPLVCAALGAVPGPAAVRDGLPAVGILQVQRYRWCQRRRLRPADGACRQLRGLPASLAPDHHHPCAPGRRFMRGTTPRTFLHATPTSCLANPSVPDSWGPKIAQVGHAQPGRQRSGPAGKPGAWLRARRQLRLSCSVGLAGPVARHADVSCCCVVFS